MTTNLSMADLSAVFDSNNLGGLVGVSSTEPTTVEGATQKALTEYAQQQIAEYKNNITQRERTLAIASCAGIELLSTMVGLAAAPFGFFAAAAAQCAVGVLPIICTQGTKRRVCCALLGIGVLFNIASQVLPEMENQQAIAEVRRELGESEPPNVSSLFIVSFLSLSAGWSIFMFGRLTSKK